MSYDAKRAIRDGGRNTIRGRLVMAITMDDGDWRAKYGENRELAEIFGCSEQYVATVRMLVRRGWRPTGRQIPLQPEGLPARLLALDSAQPGLSRKEQARILSTSHGMIRDTVWRLRRDGYTITEGAKRGPGARRLKAADVPQGHPLPAERPTVRAVTRGPRALKLSGGGSRIRRSFSRSAA